MRRRLLAALLLFATAGLVAAFLLRPVGGGTAGAARTNQLIPVSRRRSVPPIRGPALAPGAGAVQVAAGKPSLVDIWASWCTACAKEAPMLARLATLYGRRIRFVGIDVEDQRRSALAFVRRYGLDFPQLYDRSGSRAAKLGAYGIPTIYLIDSRRRVAAVLIGRQPESKLRALLEAIL